MRNMQQVHLGCVTLNHLLSPQERKENIDQVRQGQASILLISPEQLRSRTVNNILETRKVGLWVLDEAHCLSKWGHDFRPDYRYIGRWIGPQVHGRRTGHHTLPHRHGQSPTWNGRSPATSPRPST